MADIPALDGSAARNRKAEEAAAAQAKEDEGKPLKVKTAFLVYITDVGDVTMTVDINAPILRQRPPSVSEVKHGCREVIDLLTGKEIAAEMLNAGQRMGQAMGAAQEDAQYKAIVQGLESGAIKPDQLPAGFPLPPGFSRS